MCVCMVLCMALYGLRMCVYGLGCVVRFATVCVCFVYVVVLCFVGIVFLCVCVVYGFVFVYGLLCMRVYEFVYKAFVCL